MRQMTLLQQWFAGLHLAEASKHPQAGLLWTRSFGQRAARLSQFGQFGQCMLC